MAADFKEVIVDADALHTQRLAPDVGQPGFCFVARGSVCVCIGFAEVRQRQGAPVQFAIGRDGEGLQEEVKGGDHVCRQVFLQISAQVSRRDSFLGHDVGGQVFASLVVLVGQHGCLGYGWV